MSNKVDILAKNAAYETAREQDKTMTLSEAKAKLCVWAEGQVGFREGPDNENRYAENADLKRMYGWDPQNQPWCDVFVDVGFIQCFGLDAAARMTYQPMGAGSALCSQSAQYYKDNGAFFPVPEIGDQVFFYASGGINHTGIVVGVDGGSVITVEGNSSDQVAERVYSVIDSKIAGYGRPKWSVVTDGNVETTEDAGDHFSDPAQMIQPTQTADDAQRFYTLRLPYLSRSAQYFNCGDAVTAVQFQLAAQGYDIGPDGADGDYGYNTERAVKEFQGNVGITADGIVGPNTGARLFGGEVYTPGASVQAGRKEAKQESGQGNVLGALKNLFRRKD